jgi:hypothetical protein
VLVQLVHDATPIACGVDPGSIAVSVSESESAVTPVHVIPPPDADHSTSMSGYGVTPLYSASAA